MTGRTPRSSAAVAICTVDGCVVRSSSTSGLCARNISLKSSEICSEGTRVRANPPAYAMPAGASCRAAHAMRPIRPSAPATATRIVESATVARFFLAVRT